jgi:hypothetical protein
MPGRGLATAALVLSSDIPVRLTVLHTLLLAVALAFSSSALAQLAPAGGSLPPIGSRIRLSGQAFAASRLVGRLRAVRGDSLVIAAEDALVPTGAVALSDIDVLEVYAREKEAEHVAAALGIAGAVAGGVTFLKWCHDDPSVCQSNSEDTNNTDCEDDESECDGPLDRLALMTIGGGILGGLLGYGLVSPGWEVFGTPLRIGVAPTRRRGFTVYASFALR